MKVAGTPNPPPDWQVEASEGLGPFVTTITYRTEDGSEHVWNSRFHRKHDDDHAVPGRTWWIAALFSFGSACFAVGSMPNYFDNVSTRTDALTFFVGSIFFTSAAYLSFAEVCGTPDAIGSTARRRLQFVSWKPHSIDWWATSIQFAGTIAFNVTTFAAIDSGRSPQQDFRLVWVPDMVGSIFFLLSSYLAWAEVCHSVGRLKLRDISWWIVGLNLLGSVFFGISAVAAKVMPDDQMRNLVWVNLGTFLGALCFLAGAVMLVPEARRR